ncbi:MAG: hypothetical protein FJZ88_10310 [Chloroflexi bacterium]|nr:hypothetical protein [Chloroflexota bacterium]
MQTTLKDFVEFIQTTWGILASITAFFPLFGSLIPIMPAPEGKRLQTSTMATICSGFVLYLVFLTIRVEDPVLAAIPSLILVFFAIFCFIKAMEAADYYEDARTMLFSILTFMSLTGAFSILAALDFWRGR